VADGEGTVDDVPQAAIPPHAFEEGSGGTLAESLYDRLRGAILGGRLLPGARLRLDELKAQFGVSLSPLREALSRLAAEGFVVSESQRGFAVAPVSRAMFEDVIRLRTELEGMALRDSISRGGEEWEIGVVAALHRLRKLESQRGASEGMGAWEQRHREFHLALIGACESPLLLQFCATLRDLNDRYRRLFLANYALDRNVADEHQGIADAALARDAGLAGRLLREHVQRTARNVFMVLDAAKVVEPAQSQQG